MNSVIYVFPTVYAKMNDSGQNARIRSETVRDRGAQTTFNDQVSLYLHVPVNARLLFSV